MENLTEVIAILKANWDGILFLWSLLCGLIVGVSTIIAEITHNEVDPKTAYGKFVLFCDRFAIRKAITTVKK